MGSEYPSGRKRRKGAILKKNGTNCRASGSNSAYSRMRAASAAEGRQLRSRTRAQASRGGAPPPHPPAGSLSVVGPRHDNWPLSSFNWPHFDVSSPQRLPSLLHAWRLGSTVRIKFWGLWLGFVEYIGYSARRSRSHKTCLSLVLF